MHWSSFAAQLLLIREVFSIDALAASDQLSALRSCAPLDSRGRLSLHEPWWPSAENEAAPALHAYFGALALADDDVF
jgi:hypothetical protein